MSTKMKSLRDFELARLVPLSRNLHAASFFLMKLLPARFMLEQAVSRGQLLPRATICESSSGTFGLALSMLAAQQGHRLVLISDWALDRHLHRRLIELGTEVIIVTEPASHGGLQQARLDVLARYMDRYPESYWPAQYDNPDNPNSYGQFAAQLIDRLGRIDCLVGPVGSGGSMSGTVRYLRTVFPDLHAIGVDTPNSVLFGQPPGRIEMSGLGGYILPKNVDHRQFDEVHWLTPMECFRATHDLHRLHGLFMGPTSGASYRVAAWWARNHPGKTVVSIFPDEGHRYVESVYDPDWLASRSAQVIETATEPTEVASPSAAIATWSRLNWGRRSIAHFVKAQTFNE